MVKVSPLDALARLIKKVNYKTAILIFLIGILIFSDIFTNNVLINIDGATYDGEKISSKGTTIQLMILSLCYIVIDLLRQGDLI